jgi:hypothetical protein
MYSISPQGSLSAAHPLSIKRASKLVCGSSRDPSQIPSGADKFGSAEEDGGEEAGLGRVVVGPAMTLSSAVSAEHAVTINTNAIGNKSLFTWAPSLGRG